MNSTDQNPHADDEANAASSVEELSVEELSVEQRSGEEILPERPEERSAERLSRSGLVGLLPALLVIAVALWEIVAAGSVGDDVPGDGAWEQAGLAVRARHQPGDLIVFAPEWIDPVGRRHLGDLIPLDMAARMDDARYARVFELSIRGADAPESKGRRVAWSETVDGIRVRLLTRAPVQVLTDFLTRLEKDRGSVKVEGRPFGGVRVRLEEVGFEPHRCIRVRPEPDETVRVIFEDVRLGSSLVGYVGLADVFTRRDHREPGRLEVSIDDQEVASVEFGVDDGWVRFAAETRPSESAQVVFAATAVGRDAHERLICFAAEARK